MKNEQAIRDALELCNGTMQQMDGKQINDQATLAYLSRVGTASVILAWILEEEQGKGFGSMIVNLRRTLRPRAVVIPPKH